MPSPSEPDPKDAQTPTPVPDGRETMVAEPGAGPAAASPASDWRPGAVVDELYEVRGELGKGGSGTVHKVYHRGWGMELAVKSLRADRMGSRRAVESFVQEANTWVGLGLHPNIVTCYFVRVLGAPRIFIEYMEGGSLEDWLQAGKVRDLPDAPDAAVQIARAMAYAHGRGLVHRDLKPDNVIVEHRSGRAVIVDFGAAICSSDWREGILGTPYYMPPEAFRGERPTAAFDVYALGCLAFELLTGRKPYEASSFEELAHRHAASAIPRPSSFRAELARVDDVFARMLAKVPEARFPNAAALGNALDDRLLVRDGARDGEGETPSGTAAPSSGSLRVLVVDDDPVFVRLLSRCVQVAFADVHVAIARASSGAAALANAERARPDLLILDYLLPDTNGVDVLSRVRALGEGSHPEVIVASGAVGSGERWRFDILGVSEVVPKPFEFAKLVEVIRCVASRRGWVRPLQPLEAPERGA